MGKSNRIQYGNPVTTAPAQKFTPVGYGYGRGPNGQTTNGYCKMYGTWTDCFLQCDREHACIGFDAEQSYNPSWQQCCIRTNTYRTANGWSSFRGNGDKVARATGTQISNRVVMAKKHTLTAKCSSHSEIAKIDAKLIHRAQPSMSSGTGIGTGSSVASAPCKTPHHMAGIGVHPARFQ